MAIEITLYYNLPMRKIYLAPLEGVTDSIYRNTFMKYYGGVDKVYTPFLSPNSTLKFTTREFKDIDPAKNDVNLTVPQLLTNKSEHFLWACGDIAALGFKEINFNLGCPSGTVVAKKKGSGLLFYPEELDKMLYEIFDGLEMACSKTGADVPAISIKTRIGKNEPEEFYEILDIYNKYPISELTIHPRIQSDFYKAPIREEFFDYAVKNSKAPLVFNGDVNTIDGILSIEEKYESVHAIMIGRGLISNPGLALQYKKFADSNTNKTLTASIDDSNTNNTLTVSIDDSNFNNTLTKSYETYDSFTKKGPELSAPDLMTFKAFHNDLLTQYLEVLSGEKPVLHRMKEFLGYWQCNFPDAEKTIKKMRKSNKISEYCSYADSLFS